MPLTSPAVNESQLEESVSKLFNEWLGSYFDGGSHAVGYNAPVVFPTAVIRFQQASIPQPLDGAFVSMVWVTRAKARRFWDTIGGRRQERATFDASWMFLIRAQQVESGQGNAKKKVRDVSDLMFAILQNSANTQPLAQKGIHHLRPETPTLIAEDKGYLMRSITCLGRLRYSVISQPVT